jgi:hypothetical protein
MKCTDVQDGSCQAYGLKSKAMISCGAGAMSALFGGGMLFVNPNWMGAASLLVIAVVVTLVCFFVPWCPNPIKQNPQSAK